LSLRRHEAGDKNTGDNQRGAKNEFQSKSDVILLILHAGTSLATWNRIDTA